MSWRTASVERLRALLRSNRIDRDLDEELEFHLAQEIAQRVSRGAEPEAARRAALAAFGSVDACREHHRDERGIRPLTDLVADSRYAVRALRRSPGFALAVILVLGLTTGAATTMFSLVDLVLLAGLPYPHAERLVHIYQANSPENRFALSSVDVQALARQQPEAFEAFGAAQRSEAGLSGGGLLERVVIGRVTAGFFDVLGVAPASGRLIASTDERAGAAPVVVLSHALATRVAGDSAMALGRSLTLDGIDHTVIGVLPRGIDGLAGVDAAAWPALTERIPTRRGPFWLRGVARLKPGIAIDTAGRQLAALSEQLYPLWAFSFQDGHARMVAIPLRDTIVGEAARPVSLFAGAVGLLLLIAVANVGTLMLVRASGRQSELAVRATLGATRIRLARLLATENLWLALAAGGFAIVTAYGGVRLVQQVAPTLPRVQELAIGSRALLFILMTVTAAAVLLSVSVLSIALPGRSASALRSDSRRVGTSRRAQTLRGVLVAVEFALALPLLLGAGLLFDSFLRLQRVDPGFDPAGVVSLHVSLPAATYPQATDLRRFWRLALARATELSGVTAAGLTTAVPPDNGGDVNNFDLLDRPVPSGTAQPVAPWTMVGGDYFGAMSIPLRDGRLFTDADTAETAPVLIVSQAWADRHYPRQRVIGRQLVSGGCTDCPPSTIVGVVGDVKYLGLRAAGEGVYEPAQQSPARSMHLVVRSTLGADGALRAVARALGGLDPGLVVRGVAMSDHVDRSLADPRRWTTVLGLFAGVALALAALGIFGLVSYVVRQRRREIGIRIALGAQPRAVTALVTRQAMQLVVAGTVVGLGLAAIETRLLQPVLFDAQPFGSGLLAGAVCLLLASAWLASWLPGRRAARIAPADVLGAE